MDGNYGTERTDELVLAESLTSPHQFSLLLRRHGDRLNSYMARRVGQQTAEDLSATLWLQAFESRRDFDATRGTVVGWLYGIARHQISRYRRTAGRRLRAIAQLGGREKLRADAQPRIVDEAIAAVDLNAVLDALSALSNEDREILELFVWEQLSYEEIAQVLGLRLGTVKSRLSRARGRLTNNLRSSVAP